MTNQWARSILNWFKRKETTGNIKPSPEFSAEEKFTFHWAISSHDIPNFVLNIDQTALPYVSSGKYTFSFNESKNFPIKGVDDKRQISATFAVSSTCKFLPTQLIYTGTTSSSLPKYDFQSHFLFDLLRIIGRIQTNNK